MPGINGQALLLGFRGHDGGEDSIQRFHPDLYAYGANHIGHLTGAGLISMENLCFSIMIHGQGYLKSVLESQVKGFHADSDDLFVGVVIIIDNEHPKQPVGLLLLLVLDTKARIFSGQGRSSREMEKQILDW